MRRTLVQSWLWLGLAGSVCLALQPTAQGQPKAFEVRWYGTYDPAWSSAQWDLKAEALKRHIAALAELNIKCDYFLTPAEVEYLSAHHPDIIQALNDSGDAILHHDTDGPPALSPVRLLKGRTWDDDVKTVVDFETHKVNPQTGEIIQAQSGGLGLMTQLFGARMSATGRFMRAPILAAEKQMGARACLGLAEDLGAPPQDAWFMGVLCLHDASTPPTSDLKTGNPSRFDGARIDEALRRRGKAASFVVDSTRDIFPWALSGGPNPLLKAGDSGKAGSRGAPARLTIILRDKDFLALPSAAEREKLWAAYARLLKAAVAKGMTSVGMKDLLDMVVDDREKSVSLSALDAAADYYTKACSRLTSDRLSPPPYIDLGGDCLSLTDAFQMFQVELAWWRDAHYFADSAKSRDILGPTADAGKSLSAQTTVKRSAVVLAAGGLLNKTWSQVPGVVKVGQQEMNPAEFLYLMCRTYQCLKKRPASAGEPKDLGSDQALPITLLPPEVRQNKKADDLTKLQFWTYKPVRWK